MIVYSSIECYTPVFISFETLEDTDNFQLMSSFLSCGKNVNVYIYRFAYDLIHTWVGPASGNFTLNSLLDELGIKTSDVLSTKSFFINMPKLPLFEALHFIEETISLDSGVLNVSITPNGVSVKEVSLDTKKVGSVDISGNASVISYYSDYSGASLDIDKLILRNMVTREVPANYSHADELEFIENDNLSVAESYLKIRTLKSVLMASEVVVSGIFNNINICDRVTLGNRSFIVSDVILVPGLQFLKLRAL